MMLGGLSLSITRPSGGSPWSGAIASSFGDSITSQQEWQPAVASALGLTHTAYGVGGRRVTGASGMCQDAAVDTIPTNTDLVLILGGVNDWSASVTLGSPTSSNTAEFYGALNVMMQKLVARAPDARLVLMTPPYVELLGSWAGKGWADGVTNLSGLGIDDYAEAIRTVATAWGVPVIDLLAECGWDTATVDANMKDDGDHIHPNAQGGARIAEICIADLLEIQRLGVSANRLTNSRLLGAVSGTPGTVPTGWAFSLSGGTTTVSTFAGGGGGSKVRFAATGARHYVGQGAAVEANTTYCYSIKADVTVATTIAQCVFYGSLPAGAAATYRINGATATTATALPVADGVVIEVIMTIADTAGLPILRWGVGVVANATADITFYDPQFEVGSARATYSAT